MAYGRRSCAFRGSLGLDRSVPLYCTAGDFRSGGPDRTGRTGAVATQDGHAEPPCAAGLGTGITLAPRVCPSYLQVIWLVAPAGGSVPRPVRSGGRRGGCLQNRW